MEDKERKAAKILIYIAFFIGLIVGIVLQITWSTSHESAATPAPVATTTVSLIAEKEECKKAGGKFRLELEYLAKTGFEATGISCTKTDTTVIFDHTFNH